jgi:hypothetical protein
MSQITANTCLLDLSIGCDNQPKGGKMLALSKPIKWIDIEYVIAPGKGGAN